MRSPFVETKWKIDTDIYEIKYKSVLICCPEKFVLYIHFYTENREKYAILQFLSL